MTLVAADGYRLGATLFHATASVRGSILMAGATGVQQRFYKRFAEHASAAGYNVLTLDYRGLGDSKPRSLKGFEMSYLDWGMHDLTEAVEYLDDGVTPIFWVGHSFGGQALGLLPNHHKITAAYNFGVGAGWAGWMPWREALKVRFMWAFVWPLIVRWKGYMAWSVLGMGDDMPLGVYESWRRWCKYRHYFFDDPAMAPIARLYLEVRTPCLFANAIDDLWAPPKSRDAFIKGYRNAPLETLELCSSKREEAIGHMGYFRSNATELWDHALHWFAAVSEKARDG